MFGDAINKVSLCFVALMKLLNVGGETLARTNTQNRIFSFVAAAYRIQT